VILHVMPRPMTMGGAQRFAAELATRQASFAETHLVYPGVEAAGFWSALLSGVAVHRVASEEDGEALARELNPDLAHHHHPRGLWLWRALAACGAAIVGTHHGWRDNLTARPDLGAVPICGPLPGVIRHGVDLAIFAPRPRERRRHGRPVVGIVGRFSPEKLPLSFVDAGIRRDPGCTLRVVGRGPVTPYAASVESRLRRCPWVEIAGDRPPASMPSVYEGLDALLVPSLCESVSYAAIEAMACGVLSAAARFRAETLFDIRRMFRDYARIYHERSGGRVSLPGRDQREDGHGAARRVV
jgi:glycosyltransferase involved in cell wall biosynthesis